MARSDVSERSVRKRADILEAATELFLEQGYAETSMDEVAAAANASKQTVYRHVHDKESLFREVVMSKISDVSTPFTALVRDLEDTEDVPGALRLLARRYVSAVTAPEVLRRRRLVIREAERLPDLARAYYDGAPRRALATLADAFSRLHERRLLHVPDPRRAAIHFAFLVVGPHLDAAMFGLAPPPDADLMTEADTATEVFLAAYAPR
jgi:TetR/AcrR family transcriptional repressor of mexJK operon